MTNVLKSSTQARPGAMLTTIRKTLGNEIIIVRKIRTKNLKKPELISGKNKYPAISAALKKEYREIIEPQKKKQAI